MPSLSITLIQRECGRLVERRRNVVRISERALRGQGFVEVGSADGELTLFPGQNRQQVNGRRNFPLPAQPASNAQALFEIAVRHRVVALLPDNAAKVAQDSGQAVLLIG